MRGFFLPIALLTVLNILHLQSVSRSFFLEDQKIPWDGPVTTASLLNATTTRHPIPDKNSSVAACLMVFDDNHYLIEWLAYHYHVLPLRRLIIHPDPSSQTSPLPILERWEGKIDYTIYDFEDIYPTGYSDPKFRDLNEYGRNIWRQRDFLTKCTRQLKREGSGWTIITDVDEYTQINIRSRYQKESMYNFGYDDTEWKVPNQKAAGSVLSLLEHGRSTNAPFDNHSNPDHYHLGDPCIGITRINFGAKEHHQNPIHSNFDLSQFATHRWRYHALKNPMGKTLVDLKRLPSANVVVENVHVPFDSFCSREKAWGVDTFNPLIAYHYSGTLEQVSFRSGDHWKPNRTNRHYDELRRFRNATAPAVIGEWLEGFVHSMGMEEAQRLLKHVGEPFAAGCTEANIRKNGHVCQRPTKPNMLFRLINAITSSLSVLSRKVKSQWGILLSTTTAHQKQLTPHQHHSVDSVAACLMVSDDNHHLIEWLAYHYHVLPLRRLIVHPDPNATTSPVHILERWEGKLNYTIYKFKDLYPNGYSHRKFRGLKEEGRNILRERDFVASCMRQLKAEGFGWTLLTDVDEYTHINMRSRDQKDPMHNFRFDETQWRVPSQKEAGSVLTLLNHSTTAAFGDHSNPKWHYHLGDPCIGITRVNFGSQEYQDKPIHSNASAHFNLSQLATRRWQYHSMKFPMGRTMIDLSRVPAANISVDSVHRPIASICSIEKAWGLDNFNPLVTNHYSGTLEQWSFQSGDSQKAKQLYDKMQPLRGTLAPPAIGDWLEGFAESVGIEKAQRLLLHAGNTQDAACDKGSIWRQGQCIPSANSRPDRL